MDEALVSLKIDGHCVQAAKGTPILQAAEKLGISIPTLCFHKQVKPYLSCRVCLVEIASGGKRKQVPSCIYPVQEGIEVFTDTAEVREKRRGILDGLLASAPGVSVIREMAREYGITVPPAPEEDEGNCINCGLCARMCKEVVGAGALRWVRKSAETDGSPAIEIDETKCIGCGACASVCPTGHIKVEPLWATDGEPRELTLGPDCAVFIPSYQAVPKVPVIDKDACIAFQTGGCRVCEEVCERNAVDHKMQGRMEEIEVGQILIATGYDLFNGQDMPQYGYGRFDNVYSGLDIEYLLNASGPTGGQVLLKDGQVPASVGIIHCVGSRDERHHRYCSRVCCMYALKFAHLVKERTGTEVYQFYIDMRSFGKGYEEFYSRVLDEGVNVIRGKVAEVVETKRTDSDNGTLLIRCEDTLLKQYREIPVEMVVLCNALEPQSDAEILRRTFSLSASPDGFLLEKHPKLDPTATASDGIYIAGCCQGPKDIPDSVAQASSAAARILATIAKGEIDVEPIQAQIDPELCSGCRVCSSLCPFGAIDFDSQRNVSVVNIALCKGCGTCVAACPSSAASAQGYSDEQIFAEINGILK
ncbi:4Fe-4S binding protein [Candidatus Neomarinimicrobiota bacterium]